MLMSKVTERSRLSPHRRVPLLAPVRFSAPAAMAPARERIAGAPSNAPVATQSAKPTPAPKSLTYVVAYDDPQHTQPLATFTPVRNRNIYMLHCFPLAVRFP